MYCRYTDNIFCMFKNKEQIQQFYEKHNKTDKDMKFVIQTFQEGKLQHLNKQVAKKKTTRS